MSMEGHEVTQEEIKAAMERYPGIPFPLAVSKYKLDQVFEKEPVPPLQAGYGWGGVHLERVGILVQKLADAMYHQGKKGMAIIIQATDFPESYDHLWVEVKEVDSGTEEEVQRMRLGGWPCCACDKEIKGEDADASWVMLQKRATWKYPTWGNVMFGTQGGAIASMCGVCTNAGMKPLYAVRKAEGAEDSEDERFERVPLSELEDMR